MPTKVDLRNASPHKYYNTVDFIYLLPVYRRFLLLPSAFSVFRQSLWTRIRKCLGGNVRERELTRRKQEKGREKRSRMDNAMRSWCNCMLMECASEYGIRMEAVRFDIPFCLRSSPLLDSTSTSSSGRLFVSVSFLPR